MVVTSIWIAFVLLAAFVGFCVGIIYAQHRADQLDDSDDAVVRYDRSIEQ